jgi:hypothetical protein
MAKLILKATNKQQAWIAEHTGKRWSAVTNTNRSNGSITIVSLHTSHNSACVACRHRTVANDAVIKGADFFDTYEMQLRCAYPD